jgi:peptidoglycan/LPS O-acetylase OafA/YrhL
MNGAPERRSSASSIPVGNRSVAVNVPALTGIRALAALWVVAFHFTKFDNRYYDAGIANPLVRSGYLGVAVFFVLSGFIMTHVYRSTFGSALSRASWSKFLQNRLARLYPVHVVTAATMASFDMIGRRYGFTPHIASFTPVSVLANLSLTYVWFPGVAVMNSPAWSISAEWFAYLLFPVIYYCLTRTGHEWPLILAPLALGACLFNLSPLGQISIEFTLGVAVYELHLRRRWPNTTRGGGFLGIVLILLGLYLLNVRYHALVTAAGSALLFTALMSPNDLFGRLLSTNLVVYLGEISYSIYMCHWLVCGGMPEFDGRASRSAGTQSMDDFGGSGSNLGGFYTLLSIH